MAEQHLPLKLFGFRLFSLPFRIWGALSFVCAFVLGLGLFTFSYGNGFSYAGNDPGACANCHPMRGVYDGWNHSSHKSVAGCNDCHVPHSLVPKYIVKAINGWHHSYAFTSGDFPDNIRIKKFSREIAQHNCVRCHGDLTFQMNHEGSKDPTDCIRCHRDVGHKH